MWRRFPKETWYCTLEITDLSAQWCPKSFKESCQILVFIPCHASSLKKMKWGQRNNIHVVKRLLSTTLMLRRCFWDRVRCLTRVWRESSFALWTSESSFSMIRGNRNWKIVYIYFFCSTKEPHWWLSACSKMYIWIQCRQTSANFGVPVRASLSSCISSSLVIPWGSLGGWETW